MAAVGPGEPAEAAAKSWPGIGTYVEAFESAWSGEGPADPAEFAPASEHPDRLAILCELVRVDLEYSWERGRPRRLDDYRGRFPEVFADPDLVRAMAFEEYRVREQAGDHPDASEYRQRFGLDVRNGSDGVGLEGDHPRPDPDPDRVAAADGMACAASAYLEYRRGGATNDLGLDVLLESRHVSREHAAFLRELDRDDPHAAERLAEAVAGLPRVGGSFLGFRLCGELGRGAFGRVFLARQGDLADRLVALKVSADVASETHALAQLQHTNVVPVYSVHRRGPFQAVCMPYLGATTLADSLVSLKRQATLPESGEGLLSTMRGRADGPGARSSPASAGPSSSSAGVVAPEGSPAEALARPPAPQIERLRGLPYVPAVLWLIAQVADGLAHAHERGILHRDLKPANILFADDGAPLLLDFSLAADTKATARAGVALVGGTLPYMAPEQLRAFRDDRSALDARSDIYGLGVILFELLTGAPPFPLRRGSVDEVLPAMIADREGPPPDPRALNPSVTPATAAIVRHCLESDPSRRYPSARALQEDLRRQLEDLPLRHLPEPSVGERAGKWARRHPRLTSTTAVGLVAGLLLLGVSTAFVTRYRRFQEAEAVASLARLGSERSEAFALLADPDAGSDLIDQGLRVARGVAARYGIDRDHDWPRHALARALPRGDRPRLEAALGEVLTLAARALIGPSTAGKARGEAASSVVRQAERYLEAAALCYPPAATPRALLLARAELAKAAGLDPGEVARRRERAESVPLRSARERLLAVADQARPDDRRRLRAFLDAAETLEPDDVDPAHWLILGNWSVRLGRVDDARHCYGVAIALEPTSPWAFFNRGLLNLENGDASLAIHDFDRAAASRPAWPAIYLNRALARLAQGDNAGAVDDLGRCLALDDAPTRAWFIRAQAKEGLGDVEGARLDREQGLAATPRDATSFVARGLARLPADPRGALADFDAALGLNPRDLAALQDKANVLSESLGRPEEAVQALDLALTFHPASVASLSGRGVLLARLGRRAEAHRDARSALALSDAALTLYQAACVFALTSKTDPADRPEALRLLAEAFRKDASWLTVAPEDPDVAPVRDGPEYRALVQAFAIVNRPSSVPPTPP